MYLFGARASPVWGVVIACGSFVADLRVQTLALASGQQLRLERHRRQVAHGRGERAAVRRAGGHAEVNVTAAKRMPHGRPASISHARHQRS
jgi:hypothetical protein